MAFPYIQGEQTFCWAQAKHSCLKWEMARLNVKQPQAPTELFMQQLVLELRS